MIICNSRRFIFVHLMKCAGTAIDATLAPHMRWDDIRFGVDVDGGHLSRIYWARHRLHKHASAAMIRDVVGQELWDSYLTMATVRCPYERVASAWGFIAGTLEPLLAEAGFPVTAAPRNAWPGSRTRRPAGTGAGRPARPICGCAGRRMLSPPSCARRRSRGRTSCCTRNTASFPTPRMGGCWCGK